MTRLSESIKWVIVVMISCVFSPSVLASEKAVLKIAMLHLELKYADLEHNANLIEAGIERASKEGADWLLTPELALTGYRFDLKIGTDWITPGPDAYVERMQRLAKKYEITLFFSHLEGIPTAPKGLHTSVVFNTLFVIDRSGKIIGRHRKINTIPVAEDWSAVGTEATVVTVDQQKVGLLICADAWPREHAQILKQQGADIILSSASWAPGEYGPGDVWEKRSLETGLPLFVNNRTGIERQFDLRQSVSVVSHGGQRLFSHRSEGSRLVIISWNSTENVLVEHSTFGLP